MKKQTHPTRLLVLTLCALSVAALGGCAAAVNPCKDKYGGLCTSPREMYGVTRNRDQVNPTPDVLKNQEKAGELINSTPKPSEKLPSIQPAHPLSPTAGASSPSGLLPSTVMSSELAQGSGPGGVVHPGPYATDSFGGQNTPMPLLRQPKVLRVWVAPYVGTDDTLHFPGYIYSVIQPGTWTFGQSSHAAQPPMPSPAQVRQTQADSTPGE
jgi:conjugal transfer pilus assembly protein TraV